MSHCQASHAPLPNMFTLRGARMKHHLIGLGLLFEALLATGCATSSLDGGSLDAAKDLARAEIGAPSPSPRRVAAPGGLEWGLDAQAYPAGAILALHVAAPLSDHDLAFVRAGYNATDRQNFGKHDEEQGGGPGMGLGYRHYFSQHFTGWFAGARVDLWALEIDWKDQNGGAPRQGSSDVLVFQPTLEVGYGFALGQSGWRLDLTFSLGAEINLATEGEQVGEGAILLGGAALSRSF